MSHLQDKYNEWPIDAKGTIIGFRTPATHNPDEDEDDQCDRHDATLAQGRKDYPEHH